jgi:aspartyl-tRNA(Asn)/glutamyl-tRNA(Gln) amidotransferase subunit A
MSEVTSSVAGRSFSEAEHVLHQLPIPSPRLAPPFDLHVSMREKMRAGDPIKDSGSASTWAHRKGSVLPSPVLTKAPTLSDALRDLAAGRVTSRDLVEASLAAASDTVELGAVVAIDEESVREEADRLDRERAAGKLRGPLHGIPVTVKDIIDVSGLPTLAGSLAYSDESPSDAAAVARLRSAGALLLAKVATHEFALGVATPQCRNPHDAARISGGSSGGSAIAVATGIGVASLGTDTRASLRVPAHCCGVVGFKPTFGRVPATGIVPLSWSIDHLGPITRTVEDAARMLNVLADVSFLDCEVPTAAPTFTVGMTSAVFADASRDVVEACELALAQLESLGVRIVEIPGPTVEDLEISNAIGLLISRGEAGAFHRSQGTDLKKCIPEVRDQLEASLTISAADYIDAQRQRRILGERILENFDRCDVIVSPTAPLVAPLRTDYEQYLLRLSRNTIIWSLIGAPAVSVPCGTGTGGMPVGLQLAGPPGREQDLVTLGMMFETTMG